MDATEETMNDRGQNFQNSKPEKWGAFLMPGGGLEKMLSTPAENNSFLA